ncbi:hypothetical protein BD289DRAFT_445146 [Coniella lustricola]|uniref:Nudix hydrolase domain-containing protein n=1 Tax=Coniella lustricola TaxID=2025994 RepID=A0A2T2ZV56_9PEZI|nr:hypothetical protein BD289DRAFT_445146 [Coniella lustricola]
MDLLTTTTTATTDEPSNGHPIAEHNSTPLPPPPPPPPTEAEVQTIVESIAAASSASSTVVPLSPDADHDNSTPPADDLVTLDPFDVGAYWDIPTMAPLNAVSAAAIARLRAYKPPPFPLWDALPVSRRAAVLILLYADRRGDLRVVLTMRAATLRSFSGHAAFPGGKADTLEETPYEIARREAWEEIGLPINDAKIPAPFRIEHLCYLPHSLAKTELAVRPCVALLHSGDDIDPRRSSSSSSSSPSRPTADESLIPRLDAKEVAAVFSGPLHNFLLSTDEIHPEDSQTQNGEKQITLPPGKWYEGKWVEFKNVPWRAHYFYVPVTHQRVTKPKVREGGLAALEEEEEEGEDAAKDSGRYMVWGMTGRMLVDTARVAYAQEPEFEHNSHFGDEALIERLAGDGRLYEKKRRSETELVQEEAKKVDTKDGSRI